MSDFSNNIVDALGLWAEGMAGFSEPTLPLIRLDGNERYAMLCTTALKRASLHYEEALRSYVHCNGPDCVLCKVGRQTIVRDLLPVYDPLDKVVALMSINPSCRPQALRPQLVPLLQRLATSGPLLVGIRQGIDRTQFTVRPFALPDNADDGAAVIRDFLQRLKDGVIDLSSVYPRQSNESLAALPEVERLMKLRGIKLS